MVWDIDSTPISNPQFLALRRRLLLSYLAVMVTILGSSALAVYQVVAHNLNQQLNNHLLTLAETAAQTLEVVKHEYYEHRGGIKDEDDEDLPKNLSDLMKHYQKNEVLKVKNNHQHHQGVEWFDEKQQLLVREGNLVPNWSLGENLATSDFICQKNNIRSLALPVFYQIRGQAQKQLKGYIRASESREMLNAELNRLRLGLVLGGAIALGLTAVGGRLLTRESLKPIEASIEQLQQFTADASHELRSPLTVIKTNIAVIRSHPERIDQGDVEKLEAIASSTEQMTRLVEDLLLLARLDGKTMTHQWLKIPIDEIIEDLLEFAELEADKKHIILTSHLRPNVLVLGDAHQLQRLFNNLINNALQYTPAGGKVAVSLELAEDSGIFTVEDTGIGIAEEDLPRVFDRLWRADKARVYCEGGTGLGMAIAQTIAQTHGGKISVTSQLGVGTCFEVILPLFR
ncbi:MAG: HAMP domain-containing histidine kinase [Gomphosphaeria aponina SAG 52.96 = DSM 107014]|uniref:histidine kinase n=1 Tax=Gomphosphaeria aponina SAG 52.96 = DSM 107014 TaxID=1521640 RepID=A0A941JL85_9CHRO|nr:HAMP domain-containing histidine kinase [Gomphosphaeria aponina SAG 52.96 = DSM 107014]